MARRKDNIIQQDFSYGAVRKEAIERDDTALVTQSLFEASNTIGLTPGSLEGRPGLVHVGVTASSEGKEVDLGRGRVFDLHIVPDGVILYNLDGSVEVSFAADTWVDIVDRYGTSDFEDVDFWVVADPDTSSILIGAQDYPIHAMVVDDAGSWGFGVLQFATSLAGAVHQPYWNYYAGVTIQPSGRTGSITITASEAIWVAAHEGMRVRFHDREILLGAPSSTTVINATVIEELPPTYDFTVASVSGYQVGDAVEHDTLGGQGIITGISGSIITVLATEFWDGFDNSGKLVAPKAKQTISVQSTVSTAASFLWDIQMLSAIHGYAGDGSKHAGRGYLCDFPSAPLAFAVSTAGFISDFNLGIDKGSAFVEAIGANDGGSLKFIISAEDLIFMTTKGMYVQQTRDGSAVTPGNIAPDRFSRIGCAPVRPVAVDDGAIFVDAVGGQIFAAVLAGDQYRAWSTRHLTKYHSQHINLPRFLGATSSGSEVPETFIYVVNSDGTAAVCQWDRDNNSIGWRPWSTEGDFKAIYQVFGKTFSVVDRVIDSVEVTYRERFETGIFTDCTASLAVSGAFPAGQVGVDYFGGVTAVADHLDGHMASVYFEGWDLGDREINASGAPLDNDGDVLEFPTYDGILQIGLPFEIMLTPWPRRSLQTFAGYRAVKRIYTMLFTVQNTGEFSFDGQDFGAYRMGEDITMPPPLRSEEVQFVVGGRDSFLFRSLIKDRPGPFRLLRIRYKVTV